MSAILAISKKVELLNTSDDSVIGQREDYKHFVVRQQKRLLRNLEAAGTFEIEPSVGRHFAWKGLFGRSIQKQISRVGL